MRKRLDLARPVPLDVVRECLEIAVQAPSGGNGQAWHWIVLTDPSVKAQVASYYARSYADYAAAYSGPDDATMNRVRSSAQHLAAVIAVVPVLVIGAIEMAKRLPPGSQAGIWGSLLPAAWNFSLGLRARGLGSTWTTLLLDYEREVADLLGMPATRACSCRLPTPMAPTSGGFNRSSQHHVITEVFDGTSSNRASAVRFDLDPGLTPLTRRNGPTPSRLHRARPSIIRTSGRPMVRYARARIAYRAR